MIFKLLLILLAAVALFFVWRWFDGKKGKATQGTTETIASPQDAIASTPAIELHPTGSLEQFVNLPLWYDYEPDEAKPSTYDKTFWEVEPQGEYIYFLAGDHNKNENGRLNFTSASTVFSALVSLEPNSVDIMQYDGNRYQRAANNSTIDIDDILSKTVGEVISDLQKDQPSDPLNHQLVSLMEELPKGALGNARLLVGGNYFTGEGLKLSLVYEEFRSPAEDTELARALWIECHCMRSEQALEPLLNQFLQLVDRYKNMPYIALSGAKVL